MEKVTITKADLFAFLRDQCSEQKKEIIMRQRSIEGTAINLWFAKLDKTLSGNILDQVNWGRIAQSEDD